MHDDDDGEELDPEVPIELEIGDTLDLHSFPPIEVANLVRDYLDLVHEKGLRELRIIHGRGVGVQREIVRRILTSDPRVEGFGIVSGNPGATWVKLRGDR